MVQMPVALVTGAARGVGRAVALALAAEGPGRPAHAVVVADPDEAGGLETLRLLEAAGATARFAPCDVADEDAVAAAVHTATETFGRLDVLVNAAGAEGPALPVHAQAPDTWRRVFEVNVHGAFYGIRHALPHMLSAGRGVIVNVASVAGLHALPLHAAYAASMHAVVGLTRTADAEAAPHGVRVHAVCPGVPDASTAGPVREATGAPRTEETAAAVATLCSDADAHGPRQTLVIVGGSDAR